MALVTEAALVLFACVLVLGLRALRAVLRDGRRAPLDSALPAAGDIAVITSVAPLRVASRRSARRVVIAARCDDDHAGDAHALAIGGEVVVLGIEHPRTARVVPLQLTHRGGDPCRG